MFIFSACTVATALVPSPTRLVDCIVDSRGLKMEPGVIQNATKAKMATMVRWSSQGPLGRRTVPDRSLRFVRIDSFDSFFVLKISQRTTGTQRIGGTMS